jgi:hypothetical protein
MSDERLEILVDQDNVEMKPGQACTPPLKGRGRTILRKVK